MEDVLDVYARPYDPLLPVVCIDETNKQMVVQTRIPAQHGNLKGLIMNTNEMGLPTYS